MFRARNDSVVVRPVKAEANVGGVILTETGNEQYHGLRGVVEAVGPGHYTINGVRLPTDLAVGDVVLMRPGGQTMIREGGQLYCLVSERDILAVIEGGPAVKPFEPSAPPVRVIPTAPVRGQA